MLCNVLEDSQHIIIFSCSVVNGVLLAMLWAGKVLLSLLIISFTLLLGELGVKEIEFFYVCWLLVGSCG